MIAVTDAHETLPNGWIGTTVAAVGSLRVGRQRSPDRHTGQFSTKYLRAANVTPAGLDLGDVLEMDFSPVERDVFRLHPGDILLAEASGSADQVGRSAIWRGEIDDCCFQNTLIRFRPHATLPDFAHIVFRALAERGAFAELARGVGIQHLGAGRLAQMPFPLPPLAEQQRIVDEFARRLQEIVSAGAALEAALSNIGKQDRLIVESAMSGTLVETESSRAAREGRPFESGAVLLARLADERRHGLFSDLPVEPVGTEMPAGWALPEVGTVGEVRVGRQKAPKFERGESPTPYLRAANISMDGLELTNVLHMDFNEEERATYALRPGDIVLAEASGSPAHVGRAALWSGEISDCCFQNTVIRFRPTGCTSGFALLAFRHMAEAGIFARTARGVGIQHLGSSRFAALPLPLPPVAEQERIVAEAEARFSASRFQKEVARSSVDRLQDVRRELWLAAAAGRLVPQSDEDEPAATLLERLGPPTEATPLKSSTKEAPVKNAPSGKNERGQVQRLTTVLADTGRALNITELFAAAGYDRDSAGDVERFYIALRDASDTIRVVDGAAENAVVELYDAP